MGTWHTRGLRGSTLEDMVNRTNERYLEQELALIQKIPTPITPVRMDKEHRQITLAYFEQRSTVDYLAQCPPHQARQARTRHSPCHQRDSAATKEITQRI